MISTGSGLAGLGSVLAKMVYESDKNRGKLKVDRTLLATRRMQSFVVRMVLLVI